jgi:hypothetical protein
MSVYLLEWCGTGPNTRARCSRDPPRGPRFAEHPVAADALDAHARRAPGPSHPVTLASPEATGHQLGRDHFTEPEEDHGDPPTAS